ncbi:MAG: DNA cytosine methyltransferase [Bacteroidales bacterium]|nr:DNA cytosine methyltransferase [Bacteroidales bacterium]
MTDIKTFGSVCSGIEAASFVLKPLGVMPIWVSEIAEYPSRFLAEKYPDSPNLGDMNNIPELINSRVADVPDLLCGGTPCQAFSLAGWKNGLDDKRGQLTLKYIDILNEIDSIRLEYGKERAIFFWENVEGVLTDKSNAFGCFIAGLAGLEEPLIVEKWKSAGVVYGKDRNIAWRVLDAKYFGVPQQRRRIYVVGGGKDFYPERVLLEEGGIISDPYKTTDNRAQQLSLFPTGTADKGTTGTVVNKLCKVVNDIKIEAFRCYSDCLYAAYGTKWNGNAAANNGSLYFAQNGRLRRLTPLECERLMGFPDNYTYLPHCTPTNRYQATGNSWAVPVISWIMKRLIAYNTLPKTALPPFVDKENYQIILLDDFTDQGHGYLNASDTCYDYTVSSMLDIVDTEPDEQFYISPKGCDGILRRKYQHNSGMNSRLEEILKQCSLSYQAS